jgi:hypothetical protein
MPLPTEDLRNNVGTWVVPNCYLPAVAKFMAGFLPFEDYDPNFYGQPLVTTYYDTQKLLLRKARRKGKYYIVLRTRLYPGGFLAISAKTEDEKFRSEGVEFDVSYLPKNMQRKVSELTQDKPLMPTAVIWCRRYSTEDGKLRLTLDTDVYTDRGYRMQYNVLELKANSEAAVPKELAAIGLKPLQLSKFLWATHPAK